MTDEKAETKEQAPAEAQAAPVALEPVVMRLRRHIDDMKAKGRLARIRERDARTEAGQIEADWMDLECELDAIERESKGA